jgi:hypothetical protein
MANEDEEQKQETYNKDHVEKILKEKKNAMEALAAKQKEVEELLSKSKTLEESLMMKEQNITGVLEMRTKELEEERKRNLELNNMIQQKEQKEINGHKFGAIRQELAKLGADSKAIEELINLTKLDSLKYDQDHNVVLGADEEAKRLKEVIPSAFIKVQPKADHSVGGEFKALNIDSYKKIEKIEDMKAAQKDIFAAHGITLRK